MNRTVAALIVAIMVLCVPFATLPASAGGYDDQANGAAQISAALARAKASGRLVLVIFGANWCPHCRAFAQEIRSPPVRAVLNRSFSVVHVSVGRFNTNMAVAGRYGLNVKLGIPSFVALKSSGAPADSASGAEVNDLRAGGVGAIRARFDAIAAQAR